MSRTFRSPRVALAPAVIALIVLSSCGGEGDAVPTGSTIDLTSSSTNFVTVPPTPSTVAPATTTIPGVIAGTQEYVVQAGDIPIGVANAFGVSLEDLYAINGWAEGEFAFPGETILIPPGGRAPGATASDADSAVEGTGADSPLPEVGDNCGPGEHTVVEGDLPFRVAEQYDVTLQALEAENANNPAYGTFIPGQTIFIPAKSDC